MRNALTGIATSAALMLAPPAVAAPDGMTEGTSAMQWLAAQSCPTLGSPLDVAGLRTPQEIAQVRAATLDFARRQTPSLLAARTARNRVIGERRAEGRDVTAKRGGLATLDGAVASGVGRMSATLVRWLLSEWVELSAIAPDRTVAAGTTHPLEPFVARERDVETMVRQLDGLPAAETLLVPLVQRAHVCLVAAQNQIVEANADALLSLAADANAPAPLEAAIGRYSVVDPTFGADLPDMTPPAVIGTLREQIAELRTQENLRIAEAREKAEADAARQNAERRKTLAAQAGKDLAVARRFTDLLRSRATASMRPLLHPDVVLSGPNGSRSGRDAVVDALAQILSQSQGFSVGTPELDPASLTIAAVASSSRGQGRLRFHFTDGLISQLRLQQ